MATVRYFVTDVERAIRHYTENLGFTLERQMGSAIAKVSRGDLALFLSGPESSAARPLPDGQSPGPGGWNRILLETEDLEARIAELEEAGVPLRGEVVSGPGGKKILVEDPDGNVVELFEPAHRGG